MKGSLTVHINWLGSVPLLGFGGLRTTALNGVKDLTTTQVFVHSAFCL